jgi:hypothetical protein
VVMDRARGYPRECVGQDRGSRGSPRRVVHGKATKKRSCGGVPTVAPAPGG